MERSGADDAWDDGGEPLYPPAPLPAHERTWRHPSEVGKVAWELSEPPVAIGRGLLVTTGAIGSALGVAVLWLLSPMGGTDPAAAPAVTSVASVVRTTEVAVPTTERLSGSSIAARPLDTVDLTEFTLPAEDVPSTVLVAAPRPEAHASIAVSLGDRPYMVTTAAAVTTDDDATSIDIVAPGDPVSADVVSVEGDLAYLQPTASIEVISFATAATPEPGETVVVLTDEPTEVVYHDDGSAPELDPANIVEGTPVVDADGALVALCTVVIDADGAWVDMVPIPPLPAATDTSVADTVPDTTTVDDGSATTLDPSATSTTAVGTSTSTPGSASGTGSGGSTASTVPATGSTTATATSAPTSTGAPATTASAGQPAATATTTTVAAVSGPGTAWAGLRFDASASSPLAVSALPSGSPAAAAGIVVGDRIVAVDGVAVGTVDELQVQIRKHQPGDVVTFRVMASGGAERTVAVTLGAVAPSV